jgi:hypothetical protein
MRGFVMHTSKNSMLKLWQWCRLPQLAFHVQRPLVDNTTDMYLDIVHQVCKRHRGASHTAQNMNKLVTTTQCFAHHKYRIERITLTELWRALLPAAKAVVCPDRLSFSCRCAKQGSFVSVSARQHGGAVRHIVDVPSNWGFSGSCLAGWHWLLAWLKTAGHTHISCSYFSA